MGCTATQATPLTTPQNTVCARCKSSLLHLLPRSRAIFASPSPQVTNSSKGPLKKMDSQPTVPGDVADKGLGIRVVVGVTCSLSMLGALLIILTYLVMKDLRTTVRLILVHLSIMDFGSALLHLVGVTVFFDRFFVYKFGNHTYMHPPGSVSVTVRNLCRTQAFFSVYFNIGAFLWTSSLAIYLYLRIVHFNMHRSKLVFYCLGILSYVAPIPLALWLFFSHYIGYTPYGGAGWCGLKIINRFTLQRNIFVTVFGYDLLQYTTLILAGVLFVASHLHIRQEVRKLLYCSWQHKF